ncbi:MAG TPA: NAD(P)/FAD-dependent oxidoreductase [Terracidiphilus sp.]|nr:NAD(P)/FAD-dependent oxidoreductase [Terracidiphilus sp.]
MRYDVLIVGGGPAGSVAGCNLVANGLRVAILDRCRFPRLKPCGGGISCRVYSRFPYLEPVLRSVPTNFVNKVVLESPSGHVIDFESDGPMYALIRRLEFDEALLDHCKKGGIEVREDVTVSRVTVTEKGVCLSSTSGEEFEADVVIGADGVNSVVAVHAGLRGPWRPTQVAVDGTEESPLSDVSAGQAAMHVYFGLGGGYGYGYVFPKPAHVNFGAGFLLDYVKKHVPAKPYAQHLSLFEDLRARGVLSGHSERENFHYYPLPFAGPLKKISTHRILLAGDAAGFVNGFTAEGIYYAMVSGEHAARTVLAAVHARDASARFLRRYDEACEAEVGLELRKSVALQKRFYSNPALIDLVVEFASRNASVKALVARFGTGQLSYEEMKRRILVEALPDYLGYQTRKLRNWLGASAPLSH